MKRISILGSTGSIGRQTLEVIEQFPDDFCVVGLAAGKNLKLFEEQMGRFKPRAVSVGEYSKEFQCKTSVYYGLEGLNKIATLPEADLVVNALAGGIGLIPTLKAIDAGKRIALANKEVLVMAGDLVMSRARENGAAIIPIDSEHSAIYQVLIGERAKDVKRLILTCSGGPFFGFSLEQLSKVTVEEALNHPRWNMGKKITIDSATLMNKGLEVIEAHHLFGVPYDKIDVITHPESIVHSMVEFVDGSIKAQLSIPDMRIPILYALSSPGRFPYTYSKLALAAQKLSFYEPDKETFKCLDLAYAAGKAGGTMPPVLNAANEVAVNQFLEGKIGFLKIQEMVKAAMDRFKSIQNPSLVEILEADKNVKRFCSNYLDK